MARLSWTLILTAGGLAFASSAQAQSAGTAYAAGYAAPYNAPNSITLAPIRVSASVGGRCGFAAGDAPNGSVNAPELDTVGFDTTFPFKLDCTGAFRVGVVSLNGGLLTGGAVPAGYGNKAPYDVQLTLQSDLGATATSACQAAQLSAVNNAATCTAQYLTGGTNFSGAASTTRGLRVNGAATLAAATIQTIRVKASAYAGPDILTAGNYSDTLTVTVSTAP